MPERDANLHAVGRAIRRARQDLDLSQEAAAQRIGMHPNALGQIERGTRDARATTLIRIAHGLDTELGRMLVRYAEGL